MSIDTVWYGYNGEYRVWWDMSVLEAIFSRELWNPVGGFEFSHHNGFAELPVDADGAVIVIPARHNASNVSLINEQIARLRWCVIILTGDEEATFPCVELKHPNMVLYVMTPHPGKHPNADRYIVNGWTPDTRPMLKNYAKEAQERPLQWFFAGQVNHERREGCRNVLKKMKNGELVETPGFTLGLSHEDYYRKMASSKVIPCPSGAVVPDSFRLYEALEAGCIPVADCLAPAVKDERYWQFLLGDVPFPIVKYWKDLPGTIQHFTDTFVQTSNKIFAWWQKFKRQMAYDLTDDIRRISGTHAELNTTRDRITILIPTSPIKDHPDTSVIEAVIGSVRERLPDSEIILMIDGIREEQKSYTERYQEYTRRLLWKSNFEWKNVLPLVFETHHHQVAMTREALKLVRTPTLLFVEHDTPLCEEIPFENLTEAILSGDANMIRLNHEASIHPEHKHLTLDETPTTLFGVPLIRTAQWSQRPHLASVNFYREMLSKYFTPEARSMIEDKVHGVVVEAWFNRGRVGWSDFKIWMYAPEGDMKRSTHLDGRKGDPKYPMKF